MSDFFDNVEGIAFTENTDNSITCTLAFLNDTYTHAAFDILQAVKELSMTINEIDNTVIFYSSDSPVYKFRIKPTFESSYGYLDFKFGATRKLYLSTVTARFINESFYLKSESSELIACVWAGIAPIE